MFRVHHNARILCVMEHPTLKMRQNASILLDVQCKFCLPCFFVCLMELCFRKGFMFVILPTLSCTFLLCPYRMLFQIFHSFSLSCLRENNALFQPECLHHLKLSEKKLTTFFFCFAHLPPQTLRRSPSRGRPALATRCGRASKFRSSVTSTRIRRRRRSGKRTTATRRFRRPATDSSTLAQSAGSTPAGTNAPRATLTSSTPALATT